MLAHDPGSEIVRGGCSYAYVLFGLREFAGVWMPSELVMLIVNVYFELAVPKFSCGMGFAIMIHNGQLIRWTATTSTGTMFMNTNNESLAAQYRQIYDLIPGNVTVVCGDSFSIGYTRAGYYGWGLNNIRQLGLGDIVTPDKPVYVPSAMQIISISAGSSHVMMIAWKGSADVNTVLIGWGYNGVGRIGTGVAGKTMDPREVPLANPLSVTCGEDHSLVMTSDGIYMMGGIKRFERPTKINLPFIPARVHFCCCSLFAWNEAYKMTVINPRDDIVVCENMWANCSLVKYFRRFPSCDMLRFLEEHDPRKLPGVLLSIDGGDAYVIVTTTRGVYAYVERYDGCPDATVRVQLLCPL
jgi:hypothetical protein